MFESSSNDLKTLTNLVIEMVKSNNDTQKQTIELHKQLIDVCKKSINTS